MKVYLYSNGEEWKREADGKERTRIEHWEIRQRFFKCNYCGYEWDSGHFEICTDEPIKPRIIKTNKKDPDENSFSFN